MISAAPGERLFEERRFSFPGFGSQGLCYIKALVRQDSIVVLCAQLVGYRGTSVTNGFEDIRDRLFQTLEQRGDLDRFKTRSFLSFRPTLQADIMSRVAWIEHYPEGTSMAGTATYAFVRAIPGFPAWSYTTKERAAAECHVDQGFFEVPLERLRYEDA
ncbi:MAG TPA: hypothetical protein VM621_18965 [Luteibacter sp.]|uniref:hypothetical protein n=1 Tax=Luteibacter sp. TaxID=1886636 RepID=UPI002C6D7764|nr:hypothetical protein [Luteibacter sp.]HVI57130.1 hypothetical protein [Luteibacter sp.]